MNLLLLIVQFLGRLLPRRERLERLLSFHETIMFEAHLLRLSSVLLGFALLLQPASDSFAQPSSGRVLAVTGMCEMRVDAARSWRPLAVGQALTSGNELRCLNEGTVTFAFGGSAQRVVRGGRLPIRLPFLPKSEPKSGETRGGLMSMGPEGHPLEYPAGAIPLYALKADTQRLKEPALAVRTLAMASQAKLSADLTSLDSLKVTIFCAQLMRTRQACGAIWCGPDARTLPQSCRAIAEPRSAQQAASSAAGDKPDQSAGER